MTEPLVSTDWLAAHLADPKLVILDATYLLPDLGREARAEYLGGHIPGAMFMDLAELRDTANPLPSSIPDAEQFRRHMSELGVGDDSHVVICDDSPHATAARAWFVLRHFGFDNASILDGGIGKWRAEGRALEAVPAERAGGGLSPVPERQDVRTLADVRANLDSKAELVVDARGPARFSGEEAETRPGLASGHIPGAINLPYGKLLNADGTWKRGDALRQAFTDAGVDLSRPIVTSCGSGITASVLLFGLYLLGKHDFALYDGSWTEWGGDPSTPKATGHA